MAGCIYRSLPVKKMQELITTITNSIIALIDALRGRAFPFLLLSVVTLIGYLTWALVSNQAIIDSLTSPAILEIAPPCVVQRIKRDSFAVTISFPLTEKDIEDFEIKQNVSALILRSRPNPKELKDLCNRLVEIILDPEAERDLVYYKPEYIQKLKEYYENLLPKDVPLTPELLPPPSPNTLPTPPTPEN